MTCKICSHDRVKEINHSLGSGTSARRVAMAFGIGRNLVSLHSKHVPKTKAVALADTSYVSFHSGTDVLRELTRLYNEHRAGVARAQASSDTRLEVKEKAGAASVIEKLCKTFNLFAPDGTVNLNLGAEATMLDRLWAAIGGFTEEQLRAWLLAQISTKYLVEAAEEMRRASFAPINGHPIPITIEGSL